MTRAELVEPGPGLSAAEARRRQQRDGPNELSPTRRRTVWRIGQEVAREPMFQLLLTAGVIYLLLGDVGEALMLLGFIALIAAITVVQEQRTEHALEALRDLTSPRALVVRDGQAQRIAGREVVQGDLIRLTEGDRVPADAVPLSANDLLADESLLTGESVPVLKRAAVDDPGEDPGNDPRNDRGNDPGEGPGVAPLATRPDGPGPHRVYAGTMIVGGQGLARVVATGARSEIGRIGLALGSLESPDTPLHQQIRRLVGIFSVLGLSLSAGLVVLHGLMRGDWLGGLLAGITLAISMLPQEFLLILTVFMAMGAWRISQQRVLTRRAATIEALGSATVLCTDKTGTLTMNRMAVAELVPWREHATAYARSGAVPPPDSLPESRHALLQAALLACEPDPFDPMDGAIHTLARDTLPPALRTTGWRLVHEYGLDDHRPAMTHVWHAPGVRARLVAVKGAPEAVAGLCRLAPAEAAALAGAAQSRAERGLRVLAVAAAGFEGDSFPPTPEGFHFQLLGLVALADPLRPGVAEAVRECRDAGIRVVMITGDHPATAEAIAHQAGIAPDGAALTGADLAALDDAALARRVATATVFARVLPEQKLRIVAALKAQGEVVAMTGDGVNDAPSLKAAHIGIAMGGRGTDVAREASSLVLLDDDFGSIVKAIRLGRRIHDNLRKAMAFVLAVHVPIAGLSLLPLLLGWPLVFTPVHIAFLEVLIDPVCSIVFEAEGEESDVMKRPPRDPAAPLFSLGLIGWSLLQGGVVLLAVGAFYGAMLAAAVPEAQARAATFTALVASNAGLILVSRAHSGSLLAALRRPNPVLWRMLLATAGLLALALFVAPVRELFRFAPVAPAWLAAALGLALAVMLVLEGSKQLRQRKLASHRV